MAFFKASTVSVSQAFVLYMARKSNGNVVIQMHTVGNNPDVADSARMYCEKCHAEHKMEIIDVCTEKALIEHCKWAEEHKHVLASAPVQFIKPSINIVPPEGRKLKIVV